MLTSWNVMDDNFGWVGMNVVDRFLRLSCGGGMAGVAVVVLSVRGAKYVGSKSCEHCHQEAYNGWKETRMANVVRDPKVHPEAVLPDFSKPDPLRTFDLGDVAFVYGSRWKQRYFTKIGDDYFVQPAQWDVK